MVSVGQNIPRLDGIDKVLGRALYVDDIKMSYMWHGAVVRSAVAHGKIKKIELNPSFDWSRVVVADAKDIPGNNCVAMIEKDVPLIATSKVMHIGEAVLLIAAPTKVLADEAKRHVHVTFEELEPVLSIEDAKLAKIKIRNDDNIISQYTITKGDIADGFKNADVIVEGTYSAGHQEHMYIETNGMIAYANDKGGYNIVGSLQCPYYVSAAISNLMGISEDKISVRQATIGGAFGGKEDYPSILAGYCAVLSRKANHPVKIVYERAEDTEVTTKRHPVICSHRTGVKKDGTITAMEILFELDGGAYATMTPVVLSRGLIHSPGPYRCENVYARGIAYATNTSPNGAFRGFGAPQAFFPLEVHMDKVAAAIQMSPLKFREKNCLKVGDITATGQQLKESVGGLKCLKKASSRSEFAKKIKKYSKQEGNIHRGIGMSLFFHGAGFTGSGEAKLKGKAGLRLDPDGKITVLTACTDMGQGAHTVLPQMAADHLGVDISCIGIETPDTALVPNSGPTVASRTTMIMGVVLGKCAVQLKEKVFANVDKKELMDSSKVSGLVKDYLKSKGPLTVIDHYELPADIKWDDSKYKGDAYPAYAWGCNVAEVEVDMDTFEVKVIKMWLANDVGKAINPKMAEGQIEGGTLQSVGYAMLEKHELNKGGFKTNRFQNYIIPTSLDTPEMETVIIEEPFSNGPMGAKGLGELPMDGGAPAIINAVANATGLRVCELPVTPEKLYEMWKKNNN